MLVQLQQLDAVRKSLEEQLQEAKHQNDSLFDSHQREEEVMFHCLHTVARWGWCEP